MSSTVLTTKEVMERLRVKSHDTLYALVKSNRLRAVKLGREYRFTEAAVETFLEGGGAVEQADAEEALKRQRAAKPEVIRKAPATMRR